MIFSIIIPVYNVEKYLRDCLDSVLSQGFESCELICINDGSTDESLSILEEYAVKYPTRMKIFSQTNAGLSATRNKGVTMAQGKYLLFLDSDDMLKEGSLARLEQEIKNKEIDIIAFNSELYYENERKTESNAKLNHFENQYFEKGMDYFDLFVYRRGWGPSAVCFYVFNRELFMKNRLKFEIGLLHEDELFMPQIFYYAKRISVINSILYTYRIHGQSIMRNQSDKNFTDKLVVASELYRFFRSEKRLSSFICRNIYNLSLSGVQGLMSTPERRKKISQLNRKIIGKVADTIKEQFIALLIRVDIRLYHVYYKITKGNL